MSSVHHAGLPWEIGLAEAHQVLCRNRLRQTVTLETDGKLMTGHDVMVALLLGAEQFGFATAPLVTMGCRMMRVCHLGTCPFGIATQNPELRGRFRGKPEYVERFMLFIAGQMREIMARLGARIVDELVGRSDLLTVKDGAAMNLSDLTGFARNTHWQSAAGHDFRLSERADARLYQDHVRLMTTDRAFGTMLKGERHIQAQGCGGQSFGAFLPHGVTLNIEGDANDYVGKGLSGGVVTVRPPKSATYKFDENVSVGNVAFYGATGGRGFVNGLAGQRFGVRNSGATLVVEGTGNHGCEYMTGGEDLVLGEVGPNFAAGMSGGVAYVYDELHTLADRCNHDMVDLLAPTEVELEHIRQLVEEHVERTASPRGIRLLYQFAEARRFFVKVIPREYRAIIERATREQGHGLSREEAIERAFEELRREG
jgi:glutamate synthase (ferredoxin)